MLTASTHFQLSGFSHPSPAQQSVKVLLIPVQGHKADENPPTPCPQAALVKGSLPTTHWQTAAPACKIRSLPAALEGRVCCLSTSPCVSPLQGTRLSVPLSSTRSAQSLPSVSTRDTWSDGEGLRWTSSGCGREIGQEGERTRVGGRGWMEWQGCRRGRCRAV